MVKKLSEEAVMEALIGQILESKGVEVITAPSQISVHECAKLMALHHVGSLVIEEDSRIVGVLHERDISRVSVVKQQDVMITTAAEIMNREFPFVNLETKVSDALLLITHYRVRHLPVIQDDSLVGLVSIGDLTKWLIDLQQEDISNLVNYIHGGLSFYVKK